MHNTIVRNGKPNPRNTSSALSVIFSNSSNDVSGVANFTISTLLNWCKRINPRVSLPALPASERNEGLNAVK